MHRHICTCMFYNATLLYWLYLASILIAYIPTCPHRECSDHALCNYGCSKYRRNCFLQSFTWYRLKRNSTLKSEIFSTWNWKRVLSDRHKIQVSMRKSVNWFVYLPGFASGGNFGARIKTDIEKSLPNPAQARWKKKNPARETDCDPWSYVILFYECCVTIVTVFFVFVVWK